MEGGGLLTAGGTTGEERQRRKWKEGVGGETWP